MILSKAKLKLIRSLELKKFRTEHGLFVAEGPKLIDELMGHFDCQLIAATSEWLKKHSKYLAEEIYEVSQDELSKASSLKTPQQVIALFKQPKHIFDASVVQNKLCLALDGVQDPGNLGTIIRLADWFGIEDIFCSEETADVYNSKTIQACMGGLARVRVHYTSLYDLIKSNKEVVVYGTLLDGENIYSKSLKQHGIILMGNEGKGISEALRPLITEKLYIPNFPENKESSESLNVAIATAITCAEFRRQAL